MKTWLKTLFPIETYHQLQDSTLKTHYLMMIKIMVLSTWKKRSGAGTKADKKYQKLDETAISQG
jgi:hypothetical protein